MASQNTQSNDIPLIQDDSSILSYRFMGQMGLQRFFARLNVRQKITVACSLAIAIAVVGGLTGRCIESFYKNQIRTQLGKDLEQADYLTNINNVVWQAKSQQPRYGTFLASQSLFQAEVNEWRQKITEVDQRLTEFKELLNQPGYGEKNDSQELLNFCNNYQKALQVYASNMEANIKKFQEIKDKNASSQRIQNLTLFSNNDPSKTIRALADKGDSLARDLRSRTQAEFVAYDKAENLGIGILIGSFLVSIALASVLIRYTSRAIAKPIERTTKVAQTVASESNFELQAPVTTLDEIGQLTTSLNQLIKRAGEYTEELQTTADKAETANRAKSAFLANMSHELRTPLNAIIGYSEMLQEEATDIEATDLIPDLENIKTAGRHLLTMISDILDISKIEAGQVTIYLEAIDIPDLIQDIVSTVQPLINKNHNQLEVKCSEELGLMHSDLTKVRQVLLNLISNAAKFTENGTITLIAKREVEKREENLDKDSALLLYPNSFIVFEVSDTGIGMTDEQMQQIFKAFTQADVSTTRKYGGTGLGLAICERLCELLGAKISVSSQVNKGSTFKVRFPERVRL